MTSPTTTTQSAWLDDLRKDLPCHISVQVFEQPLESEPSARISVSTGEAGDKRDDLVSCAKSFSEQFKSSTFDLEPHMRILGGEVVTDFLKQVREGTKTSEEVMLRIRKLPDCEAWVNSTVDKSKKRATVVYNVIKAQHPEWTFLSEPSDQYATVSTPDSADGLKACTFRFP